APGSVVLWRGDGKGKFTSGGSFTVGVNPVSIAVGDFDRDGFLDLVTVSRSTQTSNQVSILLNSGGIGFLPVLNSKILTGAALQGVVVPDVTLDAFPDLVVSVQKEVDSKNNNRPSVDNLFTLLGNGDGTFQTPVPYEAGGPTGTAP